MSINQRRAGFPITIRAIACLLILTFLFQDIVWACPDIASRAVSQNTKLAPRSFFSESESPDRVYGKMLEHYIEENGIPARPLTLDAVKAALRKRKDEAWFKDNIGFTESANEVTFRFKSGYSVRYYDPAALPSGGYPADAEGASGIPATVRLSPYLVKELLKPPLLPALPGRSVPISVGASAPKLEDPLMKVIMHDLKNKLNIFMGCDIVLNYGERPRDPAASSDIELISECRRIADILIEPSAGCFKGRNDIGTALAVLNDNLPDLQRIIRAIAARHKEGGYSWNPKVRTIVAELVDQVQSTVIPLMQGVVSWFGRSMSPADIEALIQEAVFTARRSGLLSEDIVIQVGVADEVKNAKGLLTYRLILSMAVQELLYNAAKYSKTGKIKITASFFGAGELKVNVRDYGTGIAPGDVERIFTPGFTRATNTMKGTGYGLPNLREALESLGGQIWARSTYRMGSLFSFTLPVNAPIDVLHRPKLSAPVIIAVSGLAGSGRGTISQYLASRLGLCFINRGDIARIVVHEMLRAQSSGGIIDADDVSVTLNFVKKFLESGRLRYSGPSLTLDGKDIARSDGPEHLPLGDSIRNEIDRSERNTAMLDKVFSYDTVKKALDSFVRSEAARIMSSGEYNGIAMKMTDPVPDEGIVNIRLRAPAEIRAQRARMEVDRIEKRDRHTGRSDAGEIPYSGARAIDTTTLSHAVAEKALLDVFTQLPASDREQLRSYLNWPGMAGRHAIRLEIASAKDSLIHRNYRDIPHEKITLRDGGAERVFTAIGSFESSPFGGEHLNVAVEEATGDLYVIKKLVSEQMEDHCAEVPNVMKLTKGMKGVYEARLMSAGPGKWAGLEDALAIVYPYVRGRDLKAYMAQQQYRPMAEYSAELLDIVTEVADICAALQNKGVPGIWDIKPENIIVTDEREPVMIDYTVMKERNPVGDMEFLLYDSFEGVHGAGVEGVLPKLRFSDDPALNRVIVARLAALHGKVASGRYWNEKKRAYEIEMFRDDLKAVRDLLRAQAPAGSKPGASSMAVSSLPPAEPRHGVRQSAASPDERVEEQLAALVGAAESRDVPAFLTADDLNRLDITRKEAPALARAANEEWERIGSNRRLLIDPGSGICRVITAARGAEIFSLEEKELWSGSYDGPEKEENSYIRKHYIEKGKAVEIRGDGTVVRIRRNRSNPRSPPLEARFRQSGILDKIREARDPAVLWAALRSGRNLSALAPLEQARLIAEAGRLPVSVVLGRASIHRRMGKNGKPLTTVAHIRQGFTRYIHGLQPTIWIGEKLLDTLTSEQIARLFLEESQHFVKPFKRRPDGTWTGLHRSEMPEWADPRAYIEHDVAFMEQLRDIAIFLDGSSVDDPAAHPAAPSAGSKPGTSSVAAEDGPGLKQGWREAATPRKDPEITEIEQACVYDMPSGTLGERGEFGDFAPTPISYELEIVRYIESKDPDARICDLESGNGAFCFFAARRFADITGMEGRAGLHSAAEERQKRLKSVRGADKIRFINADFMDESVDLSGYDVLYLFYTTPEKFATDKDYHNALRKRLLLPTGMKPGARLIVLGYPDILFDPKEFAHESVALPRNRFSVYTRLNPPEASGGADASAKLPEGMEWPEKPKGDAGDAARNVREWLRYFGKLLDIITRLDSSSVFTGRDGRVEPITFGAWSGRILSDPLTELVGSLDLAIDSKGEKGYIRGAAFSKALEKLRAEFIFFEMAKARTERFAAATLDSLGTKEDPVRYNMLAFYFFRKAFEGERGRGNAKIFEKTVTLMQEALEKAAKSGKKASFNIGDFMAKIRSMAPLMAAGSAPLVAHAQAADKNVIILYADSMLEQGAVIDLDETLRKTHLIGKIVIYCRDDKNGKILEDLIKGSGVSVETKLLRSVDLGQKVSEADELKELINYAKRNKIVGNGNGRLFGVVKGRTEEMWQDDLKRFINESKVPTALFGAEDGVYSFREALLAIADMGREDHPKDGNWYRTLPRCEKVTDDIYRDYRHSLELLVSA